MADSAVAVTPGSGANIDTRTEPTNGDHRQVIVIGDETLARCARVGQDGEQWVGPQGAQATLAAFSMTSAGNGSTVYTCRGFEVVTCMVVASGAGGSGLIAFYGGMSGRTGLVKLWSTNMDTGLTAQAHVTPPFDTIFQVHTEGFDNVMLACEAVATSGTITPTFYGGAGPMALPLQMETFVGATPVGGFSSAFHVGVIAAAECTKTGVSAIPSGSGQAGKVWRPVRLKRIEVSAVAGTATTTTVSIVRLSALSGGTKNSTGWLNNRHTFRNGANGNQGAVAWGGYTAAPTATVDTIFGTRRYVAGVTATQPTTLSWDWSDAMEEAPTLYPDSTINQWLAVYNGVALTTSGLWTIRAEWVEF